jgi:hypothetical protein
LSLLGKITIFFVFGIQPINFDNSIIHWVLDKLDHPEIRILDYAIVPWVLVQKSIEAITISLGL